MLHPMKKSVGYLAALALLATAATASAAGGTISVEPLIHPTGPDTPATFALNYESATDATISGCNFKIYYKGAQATLTAAGDSLASTDFTLGAELDADTGAPSGFTKYRVLQMDTQTALTDNDAVKTGHQYTLGELTFQTNDPWDGAVDISVQPIQTTHPAPPDQPIYSIDINANTGVLNGDITYSLDTPAYTLPNITSVFPEGTYLNAPNFTLTVNGSQFYDNTDSVLPDSNIEWNSVALLDGTTFGSSTQLTGQVTTPELPVAEGTVNITVDNGSGHGTSNQYPFYVVDRDEVYVDDQWVGAPDGELVAPDRVIGANAFATIQAAVNAVNTTGRVVVYNGLYNESDITITKAMTIDGEGDGNAGNGEERDQVIVAPAVADNHGTGQYLFDPNSHSAFVVKADDVSIQDLKIDGNASTIITATNGFRGGVVTKYTDGIFDNLKVSNLHVTNCFIYGVYIDGGIGFASTGHEVKNCYLTNIADGPNAHAIELTQAAAAVSENTIANCEQAIVTNCYDGAQLAGDVDIYKNNISSVLIGMALDGLGEGSIIGGSSDFKNEITLVSQVGAFVQEPHGQVEFSHNDITNTGIGSALFIRAATDPAKPVKVSSNNFNATSPSGTALGNSTGIFAFAEFDFAGSPSPYSASYADINNNTITGYLRGIHTHNSGSVSAATVVANIGNTGSNHIHDCGTGILVEGQYSTANITNNDATISGAAYGIDVAAGTATINGNTITGNDTGIRVRDGGIANVNNNTLEDNAVHLAFEAGADNDSKVNLADSEDRSVTALRALIAAQTLVTGKTYVAVGQDRSLAGTLERETDNYIRLRSTIQGSISAATAGNTVQAMADAIPYVEDLDVDKGLLVRGEGAAVTTIAAPTPSTNQNCVFLDADNITFEGFKVTRNGGVNTGTQNQGISIMQNRTNIIVQDNYVEKFFNGVYFNNTRGHIVRRNVLKDNRLGIQMANNCRDNVIEQNQITDNWLIGILFNFDSATNKTDGQITVVNNNISGNGHSQVNCSWTNSSQILDVSGNWFGDTVTVDALAYDDGTYQGGVNPPPDPVVAVSTISGAGSAKVDFNAWLNSGTDTNPVTMGFQGDFSHLHLSNISPVAAAHKSWIQDGIDLLANGSLTNGARKLEMHDTGVAYAEAGAIVDTPCTIFGQGTRTVTLNPPSAAVNTGVAITVASSDVTIENLTIAGTDWTSRYASAILRPNGAATHNNTILKNLNISFAGGDPLGAIELGQANSLPLSTGNVVENCDLTNCNFAGLMLWAGDTDILNNRFNGMTYTGLYARPSTVSGGVSALINAQQNTFTNASIGARLLAIDPASTFGATEVSGTDLVPHATLANTFNLGAPNWASPSDPRIATLGVSVEWGPCNVTGNNFVADGSVTPGTGGSVGVYVWKTASNAVISHNAFSGVANAATAIVAAGQRTAPLGAGEDAGNTNISVQGNAITGYANGVLLGFADASTRAVTAAIGGTASNHIHNCATGISVSGAYANATIADNNATIDGGNLAGTIGVDVAGGNATLTGNTISNNETGIRVKDGGTITANTNTLDGNEKHLAFEVTDSGNATANTHNMFDKSAADLEAIANANTINGRTYITATKVLSDNLVPETISGEDYTHLRSTIQGSVDVTVAENNTVNAMAGTFVENIHIGKSLRLNGAGQIATIVFPQASDTAGNGTSYSGSQIIAVESSDVEISNLTLDGDKNPLVAGLDARNGIIQGDLNAPYVGLNVHDCTVKNIHFRGIYARNPAPAGIGYAFNNNIVENVIGEPGNSGAIAAYGGSGTITGNTVTDGDVWTNYSSTVDISGNTVTRGGITVNNNTALSTVANNEVIDSSWAILAFSVEAPMEITSNKVTKFDIGLASVGGENHLVTWANNEADGADKVGSIGFYVSDDGFGWGDFPANVAFNNNIISNVSQGIKLEEKTQDLTASGTGNSIEGGLACVNTGTTQFDFSGNYWNLDGPAADANAVAALLVNGDHVDFTPWLVSSHDADVATGFTGDHSILHVASVDDSDQVGTTGRLQEAIDRLDDGNAATGAARIIRVYEGTYAESNTAVNESVQITGINEAAVKIVPAAADGNVNDYTTNAQHGFIVQANNVKINTLTIDGNGNTSFPGNNFRTAVIQDAAAGDFTDTQLLDITANNLYRSAFKFGTSATRVDAGSVTSCIINNVETYYGVVTVHGDLDVLYNTFTAAKGVLTYRTAPVASSALLDIRGNSITHPSSTLMNLVSAAPGSVVGGSGLDRNTFNTNNGAAGKSTALIVQYSPGLVTVENNQFNSDYSDVAVMLYHNEVPGIPVKLIANEFDAASSTRAANAEGAAIILTDEGDYFDDEDGDSYATITQSNIDGYAVGVELLRTGSAPAGGRNVVATIGGATNADNNTITNCVTGVLVNEPDADANGGRKAVANIHFNDATISSGGTGVDVAGGAASISNNTLAGNSTGIHVHDNGQADIDTNKIYGNTTGIKISTNGTADIDNTDFAAVSPAALNTNDVDIASDAGTVTIGDTTANKFHASGQYIINTSSQDIDVRNNRFNLDDPATLDVTDNAERAKLWDLENNLTHKINNDTYGFLRVKEDEVFVTNSKKGDAPTGIGAIERGVNAVVDTDETVNVETGTYLEGLDINKFVEVYSADGDHLAVIDNSGNSAGISAIIPSGAGAVKLNGLKITGTMEKGVVINGLNQTASSGSFLVQDCLFEQLAHTGEALRIERAKLGTVTNSYVINCGKGIVINNSQNINVEDSWVLENYATAIEVTKRENNGSGAMTENVTIDNVYILDNGMNADPGNHGQQKEAYGIFVGTYAATGDPESAGILGKNTQITNCHIINNAGTGIWVAGQNMDISGIIAPPDATAKTIIKGNIIEGNGRFTGGVTPPNVVTDNANTDGIKIRTSANTEVVSNIITGNVRNGILVASKSGHTQGCPGTKINNNHIHDNVDQLHTLYGSVGGSIMTQLYSATTQVVDATGNWWGHVYGPDHADNLAGDNRGGEVIEQGGDVNYASWYGFRGPGELAYALNDRDGDGILDAHEDASPSAAAIATNLNGAPDTGTTETVRHLRDTDSDGVEDGVEVKQGTNPNNPASFPAILPWTYAEDGDWDNDGYRDSYEYAVGSDPLVTASIPNLGNVNNNDNSRPATGDVSLFRSVLVGNVPFTKQATVAPDLVTVYQDHMDVNRDGVVTNADVIGLRRFVELDPLTNIIPTR